MLPRKTISRSIHVPANGIISFSLMAEQYSIVYMYHVFFIHSSVDGQLGFFHVLAIVNSAAMNIEVYVSFQIMLFSGYMSRWGISRSYGSSIFRFFREPPLFYWVAITSYISIILGNRLKNILLWFMSESILSVFSSRSFIVPNPTFR